MVPSLNGVVAEIKGLVTETLTQLILIAEPFKLNLDPNNTLYFKLTLMMLVHYVQ